MAQNYSNHKRFVPGFHLVTSLFALIVFALAAYGVVKVVSSGEWIFSDLVYKGILPLAIALVLILLSWYTRTFAVTVQDRAIRAEERLRYYILSGKPLDHRLTMDQIIALRFAHDDEYLPLVQRAIDESMSPDDIKKAIKNWREDHHRV